jgi:hypothetical protein
MLAECSKVLEGRWEFPVNPASGSRSECGGYLVRANASGFPCDRKFEPAKPAGRQRVLVFATRSQPATASQTASAGQICSSGSCRMCRCTISTSRRPAQTKIIWPTRNTRGRAITTCSFFIENIRRVDSQYRWFMDDSGRPVLYGKQTVLRVERGRLEPLQGVPPPPSPIAPATLRRQHRRCIATIARFSKLSGLSHPTPDFTIEVLQAQIASPSGKIPGSIFKITDRGLLIASGGGGSIRIARARSKGGVIDVDHGAANVA